MVRHVFFFDLDNTLYHRSHRIQDLMSSLISQYFTSELCLSSEEAESLHMEYYRKYGLALEGLVRFHKIDPMDYNKEVDDALPLEEILKPDDQLRSLLSSINRRHIKPWIFTNAYIRHAERVLNLLNVGEYFEGITYCDYNSEILICKPHDKMFLLAMEEAGVTDPSQCYFVDDSYTNCIAAKRLGWKHVVFLEDSEVHRDERDDGLLRIRELYELRGLFPEVFSV
ncbi:hypothetical protein NEOLI_003192 [Neolecta irregularis DAH-3]|uniref:Suppressor of disruption of TFIIS n=1 Tax=Neolecta irregularis (strain DAH-3) TaxID=1198029 RepID=A0A1U7LUU4_NEOID|nr:hypothetical protein NEOLI_003192 [Neolecta irregularis DAH-3]|eukprot:OLL26388.1 hypothetical protein NEOLI_003192 [Neolecta irregularis DAH-3]